MRVSCGSKTILVVFGFCLVGLACVCRAGVIFEDVVSSAEVSFPANGAIFYVENPGDYRTITATGESEISYTVTTDDAPLSVLHVYSITLNGTQDGDAVFHFQPNTTTVHSFATGPLTLTKDCGVGRHWVGVNHQAINVTTGQIIGSVTEVSEFHVKVMPAVAGGFEELDVLPGYSRISAYDISGDGSTVVGWCLNILPSGWPEGKAFRWRDGTMINLGCLAGYPPDSIAFGVSADGSVVVGISGSHPEWFDSSNCWAFRWAGGAMSPLPAPVIPDYVTASCSAHGVSADGSVVVGNVVGSDILHSDLSDACRWAGGPAMFLGSPWPYPYNNYAHRVSADGSVVVGYGTGGGFRWKNGTIISIGGGTTNQGCNGVSADGSVVVGVGSSGGFRWENGAMTNLGQCMPHDVSADGSVIVGDRWDGRASHAFIWDANHGMRNLRDVLVYDYLIDLQAYPILGGARAISDDGFRILVGGNVATLDMGVITDVRGSVTLDTLKANMLDRVRRLSTAETAADGKVRIRHPSGSQIDLAPNSKIQADGSVSKTKLDLLHGKIRARVRNHPGSFKVVAPQMVSSWRGTELLVEATSTESKAIVLEGEADVSTPDGSQHVLLGENQAVIATDTGLGTPFDVDPNQIDRWWEWADQGGFYADFDLEYICQTPLRAILFEASIQEVTPDWTLELENSGGLSGPDWQIDSLTFEAPYELSDLDPEPDIVAGHDYVWTDRTLGPGQDGQVNAEQNTSWEPVYLPYTIGREFAGNPITGEGDLTTTVIVTPGDDIRGFEVGISVFAAENERAREEGDFFGTLSHVSYSTNADTASDFDHESTPISQEYEWEFWDGYVPGQALTFTVTVHVDLDAGIDSALIEPRVEVAGKMNADDGSEAWVENRLDLLPQDAAIIIDSNEQVDSSDSYISWIGVDMPQYVELTGTATVPTPPGHDVPITLLEGEVDLTFESVQTQGNTSVTYCSSGPDLPANFQIQGMYYDISTTAVFSGSVEICFNYDDSGLTQDQEQALQILRYDIDHWEDVTTLVDTMNNVICGQVTEFSEFVVAFWRGGPICIVNFKGFARFAEQWLETGSGLAADLSGNNEVDFVDLGLFVDEWLYYCPYNWPLK